MTRSRRVAHAALVLVVGAGAVVATAARAATLPVPGTSATVDASGWLDGLAIVDTGGGPRQRPQALAELSLLGRITRSLRTQLTLRGRVGGPFEGGHPGLLNFVHEFQNRTPSLEVNEAFAELRLGDAQLRAGIQKFAWGKLDGVPPTDVLTPRDLHDPLVRDYEESKIGVPAVQLAYWLPPVPSIDLHDLKLSLVYLPIAVPARIALLEERWFPPSVRTENLSLSQEEANRLLGGLTGGQFPTLRGPVRIPFVFHTLNKRPPTELDAGGIAFRLGGTIADMDWSISHYTGPETGPNADLIATARCPDCIGTAATEGTLPVHATAYLRQAHDVIHMTGADWSAAFLGATVRAEVAVFQNRPYLRNSRDVVNEVLQPGPLSRYGPRLLSGKKTRVPLGDLFPDRNTVEWGVGADYLVAGWLPLLQVNEVVFTDSGPSELLSDPETRLLASVRKRFFQDTVEIELRGVYAFERAAWWAFPRITYRAGDHWRFRMGYVAVGGPLGSVIGQFNNNDELTLEARYGF